MGKASAHVTSTVQLALPDMEPSDGFVFDCGMNLSMSRSSSHPAGPHHISFCRPYQALRTLRSDCTAAISRRVCKRLSDDDPRPAQLCAAREAASRGGLDHIFWQSLTQFFICFFRLNYPTYCYDV